MTTVEKIGRLILKNDENLTEYIRDFAGEDDCEYTEAIKYMVYKVEQRNMQKEEFLTLYAEDKVKALEELFLIPIMNYELARLDWSIKEKILTIEDVYDYKMEYKKEELLHLVCATIPFRNRKREAV